MMGRLVDERIAERELDADDLAWAKPYVDEGLAALERGEILSQEEYAAHMDRLMKAISPAQQKRANLCRMTRTHAQILDLFQRLPPDERREVMESLKAAASSDLHFDRLTGDQRRNLDEGITQAQRDEVVPARAAVDRLAKRFNFAC